MKTIQASLVGTASLAVLLTWTGLPLSAQDRITAIRNATVETMSDKGRIENATIVIRGGQIEAVGTDVTIPETAQQIDARGKVIVPGFVDPYFVVNVGGAAAEEDRVVVFRGRTFRVPSRSSVTSGPFTRIVDNFYPYELTLDPYLRSGVTLIQAVSSGYGQSALAQVTPDHPNEMVIQPEGLLYVAVSNNSQSLNLLRSQLGLASGRGRSGPEARSGPGTGSRFGGGPPPGGRGGGRFGSRGDGRGAGPGGPPAGGPSELPLWRDVVQGNKPLVVNADNSAAILHLLRIVEPHEALRLVLIATGTNVYETLEELKGRKNVAVIIKPSVDTVPYSEDRMCVPALLHEAKIPFAFSLGIDSRQLRDYQDDPLLPVAYMIKYGVPRQVALEALTSRPARLLGIEKTHGSIEAGKTANLLVFAGDPFAKRGCLEEVWIEGRKINEP